MIPDGLLETVPGDRIFETFLDIVLAISATQQAMDFAKINMYFPMPNNSGATFQSSIYPNKELVVRMDGVIQMMLNNVQITSFGIGFDDRPERPEWRRFLPHHNRNMFQRFSTRLVSFYFVSFFEPWSDWIKLNISTDYDKWPAICNFGRVIRNAATHGGKVNIHNTKAKPVCWHSLCFDHTKNGQEVFGKHLSIADVILLMFEVDDELTQLGAPVSL